MRLDVSTPLPDNSWGFRANTIREDADKIDWPEMEILQSHLYEFQDFVEVTPTVCTASAPQKEARMRDPVSSSV